MASGTLSQDEIDSLMGGSAGAGQAAAPSCATVTGSQDVQLYDFRRPHRISKERLRTLEAMYDRLAKGLEGWLAGRTRGKLDISLQSVEQFTFGEFMLSLPKPCVSYTFDVEGTEQQGVIDFGPDFAFFLVDRLFGGSSETVVPNRALTGIEQMAVRLIADKVLTELVDIWQDHVPLEVSMSGFESVPDMLIGSGRKEPILAAHLSVTANGMSSLLLVCLPFNVLDKFFASSRERRIKNAAGSERRLEENRKTAEPLLRSTGVPVSARLPGFALSLEEIGNLRVGSLLTTGISRDSLCEVRIAGESRYLATAGRAGRNLALRITETVDPGAEREPAEPLPHEERS